MKKTNPHDYNETCQCYRCKGIRNNPSFKLFNPRKRTIADRADREEQHARYIDCGPGAWDDRD